MENDIGQKWNSIAQKYWSSIQPIQIDPETLRSQIWIPLESDGFTTRSLLPLENLQILEKYLWPVFSEEVSNHHVILITFFVNIKQQGNLDPWAIFADRTEHFGSLFQRVLSLSLDSTLSSTSSLSILNFIASAFQSLEKEHVRKECAPLVSIATWHNLHGETVRDNELQKSTARQKAWRSYQRRFENAEKPLQIKMQFDRAWLYSIVLDVYRRVNTKDSTSINDVIYCERLLEFFVDLISQLPTRRYSIVLLRDLNVIPVLKTSVMFDRSDCATFRDLVEMYQHFADFEIDDVGTRVGVMKEQNQHYDDLAHFQSVAFQHFEQKLKVLALSNYASIDRPGELQSSLSALSSDELKELCASLQFRTSYPPTSGVVVSRDLLLQILITAYSRPQNFKDIMQRTSVVPTEESLYDATLLRNETYDGSRPLALPKLNLQYLSLDDFLWRSFQLQQAEAFYEIRKDMENIVRRMNPRVSRDGKSTSFEGFSKMAIPIEKPALIEAGQAKVGSVIPSFVRAEVILDVSHLSDRITSEWDSLRPKDTVFLLGVKAKDDSKPSINGSAKGEGQIDPNIAILRTAEVVQVLDDSGKPLSGSSRPNGVSTRAKRRRLILDLDPVAYQKDQERLSHGRPDIWSSVNVVARRQGRENNFRSVLETVQHLVCSDTTLSSWLQDVYLGYGDPTSASTPYAPDRIEDLDFLDTFLDWKHLQESFPDRKIATVGGSQSLDPPYKLHSFIAEPQQTPANPRKRRREQMENEETVLTAVEASTYRPQNTGPYLTVAQRKNTVRFTPAQIRAIISGTQPGLSLIVGPPGTGKTDVATQIINLLYHNFPNERILLVAHSNQALNQLFQKIIALDIDSRHLLRLGHGEEDLETEVSYSRHGRVDSFLENRQAFLSEVDRLAASVSVTGAHGSTCETADYFNQVYIQPAWSRFWSIANSDQATSQAIIDAFPFKNFFSNAPVAELLPKAAPVDELREIAQGCRHHLDKLFSELESIRPFEILRSSRDQANYLLIKEARIIAMTSTHAAIRRSEIADLGFHYDTMIMEEAAQITEIESFIPCAMQNPDPKTGTMALKRVVLVGDHLQNSPVVQNLALRQYANLEQSLFLRLVRLGVPTITLNQQGRCRPSIAKLFNWRYEDLTDLPHLSALPEFQRANAGFRHEFQFIDVPEYQGQGEREPTPHFIQNLGEAEYAVALYQYMRLLGYPARSISILTTYAGQRALLRDVLEHRCKGNRLFGMPRIVTTVDKYQGEQNDYVILSMVRTKSVGYLRDVRRLTVALSRARLGLYILGRKELFDGCFEMNTAMERLGVHGEAEAKLEVVTGEMFPASRLLEADVASVSMEGVEHLGQYVYEMTQAKVKSLGGTANIVDVDGFPMEGGPHEDADIVTQAEADLEEDPLHETM